MAQMRILSAAGDVAIEWDPRRVEAGDPEALKAVREAERIFEEHRGRGAMAFKADKGQQAERLDVFDPKVEQIVIVPRVAGG